MISVCFIQAERDAQASRLDRLSGLHKNICTASVVAQWESPAKRVWLQQERSAVTGFTCSQNIDVNSELAH